MDLMLSGSKEGKDAKGRNDSDTTELNTLVSFVDEKKNLISVVGIFAALTIFAKGVMIGSPGEFVSFLFLTSFVLLWLELWSSFPSGPSSTRLALFENSIIATGIVIIWYWAARLKEYSPESLVFIISISIASPIIAFLSKKIKKYNFFNNIFNAKKNEKTFLRFVVGLFIFLAVFIPIESGIDYMYSHYKNEIDAFFSSIIINKE